MIGMDYGANNKLAFHGSNGPIVLPRLKARSKGSGPRSQAESFIDKFKLALAIDDIVTEAATIGSSGAEKDMIRQAVEESPNNLYTISGHAVKNYRKDHNLDDDGDGQAAEIIYLISQQSSVADGKVIPNCRITLWQHKTEHRRPNKYRSVRPYDKRDYRDPFVDRMLKKLPRFAYLSDTQKRMFGNGNGGYSPAKALPLAMALDEYATKDDGRDGFMWVLGMSEKRRNSFYSRKVIEIMQDEAKYLSGVKLNEDVTKYRRKQAWSSLRLELRRLYYMSNNRRVSFAKA